MEEYSLWSLSTYYKCVDCGTVVTELHGTRGMVGEREAAIIRGVVEHSIFPARHEEWDVLVGTAVINALPVLILQEERLTREVHLPKSLSSAHKAFVRVAFERHCGTVCLSLCHAEAYWQCIIAWWREMVVAEFNTFLLISVREDGKANCWLRFW